MCFVFNTNYCIFDLDHVHDMNESQGLVYLGSYAALFVTVFAFITTLMREIIKDMEDKKEIAILIVKQCLSFGAMELQREL